MKYKIINGRFKHSQMKQMVGKTLIGYHVIKAESYAVSVKIIPSIILGIRINEKDQWEFVFDNEKLFNPDEPLFLNEKSMKRYLKKNYQRDIYKGDELWK